MDIKDMFLTSTTLGRNSYWPPCPCVSIWWFSVEPVHLQQLRRKENIGKRIQSWGEDIRVEDSTKVRSLKERFLLWSFCGNGWSCPLPAAGHSPAGHEQ